MLTIANRLNFSYLPVIEIHEGSAVDNFQGDVNARKGGEVDGLTTCQFSVMFEVRFSFSFTC